MSVRIVSWHLHTVFLVEGRLQRGRESRVAFGTDFEDALCALCDQTKL